MDKHKGILVGAVCVMAIVIGYGFTIINVANDSEAFRKTQEFRYVNRIAELEANQCKKEEPEVKMEAVVSSSSVAHIIRRIKPQLDVAIINEIDKAIMKYSAMYKLPPELVVYVMDRESKFSTLAKSSAGAIGLMQILPKYHRDKMDEMGIEYKEVYHIDNNVRLGCWILREYYNNTKSIDKALTRYVGGKHNKYVMDILVNFTNEIIGE